MTTFIRMVTITSAALLSLAMLIVNMAFEIAGSVPDIDGCGFLAGSLAVLLLLYPALAAALAARATSLILRRGCDDEARLLRCGGKIGGLGSAAYFIIGIMGVVSAPHSHGLAFPGWAAAGMFVGVAYLGGRLGALHTILRVDRLAARQTGR